MDEGKVARPRPGAVEALRKLIEDYGLGQGDAACLLGFSNPYADGQRQVNRWLNGKVSPPATLLAAIDGARARMREFPESWRHKFRREKAAAKGRAEA